ncbi:MAG: glycosyltransferase family 9 protein [Candidatus Dadabacteria bacterium]
MRFLIIRLSSIGDIVLTTPVIRCLKQQVPGAEIHFLIKPQYKQIVESNPYIQKIHVLQQDWNAMIEELKSEGFNYIIDLHHNLRTLRLKNALKIPSFSYNKLNIEKLVFVKLKWNVMPKLHIIDRYLETVKPFGVYNDGKGLDYFIPADEEITMKDIPASHHLGYLALIIGASYYTKKLPTYKLQEFCKRMNYPIILLGAKEEFNEGEEIRKADPDKVYNACGKFSLHESADIVRHSRLVIAHDTGLMHIAAALKKNVIAIWGSTTPSFGMVPYYGEKFLNRYPNPYDDVQVHKLWCRPCTKFGRRHCPQGHFKCMKDISITELVQKANKRLNLV